MKTCKNCGAQMEDNAKFCTLCGTPADLNQSAPERQENSHTSGNYDQGYQQNYGESGAYQNQNYYGNNYGPGYSNYGPRPAICGLAVASLVFGIVGIITGWLGAAMATLAMFSSGWLFLAILLFVPSALGLIFGIAGIMKTSDGWTRGRGMAIAGLVLGIIFLALWGIAAVIIRTSVNYSFYGLFH